MKRQLSSIDIHFLLQEIKLLEGSRIDKIYHPEKNLIVFSLYKTNTGKKLLRIDIGKLISIADEKEEYPEILGFGQFLRKNLDGLFLSHVEQIKPERIVKLTFKAKELAKHLYIEFIGKGNAILCDDNGIILNALEQHDFSTRSIRPKLKYAYPIMTHSLFDANENSIKALCNNSKKDTIVTSLATELGFGGLYAEEICFLSNIDKNINPNGINLAQIESINKAIRKIINHKIEAQVIFENQNIVDFSPFELKFYSNEKYSKEKFETFNEAASVFFSQFKEIKESDFEKKFKSMQRIIEGQKQTIVELKQEEKETREKGEIIYQHYQLIQEILEEVNKASKKYSWKEIKEKLKGHKVVKEINEKDRKIVVEI